MRVQDPSKIAVKIDDVLALERLNSALKLRTQNTTVTIIWFGTVTEMTVGLSYNKEKQ